MRYIFLALILIGGATPSWAADLKGTVDSCCEATTFRLRTSHAGDRKGALEKEIVLRFDRGHPGPPLDMWVSAGWLKVEAKLCDVGSGQCEPARAAKIRLDLVSHYGEHASGLYSIDFSNGQHEEGKFTAKYHRNGPECNCE
jgi:hypothetical protein